MPKLNRIEKCRKDQGPCGKCGEEIKKGQPYVYWEFFRRPPCKRCDKPGCRPKLSEMTQSEFWQFVFGLQEQTAPDSFDDLDDAVDSIKEELESQAGELEDKKSNMPDGLQEGDTGQLLEERAQALNDCVSEIEGIDVSWDAPENKEDDETDEEFQERRKTSETERIEEIWDEVQGALGNISCS